MAKLETRPKPQITIKPTYLWISAGVSLAILFIVVMLLKYKNGIAGEEAGFKKYGFDVTAPELRKVDFTVLNGDINSTYDEARPYISADGQSLFFARRRHPENIFGKKDDQDIWVANKMEDGNWGSPKNLGTHVNTRGRDAICSISPDGKQMILINSDLSGDKPLQKTTLFESGWSTPIPVTVKNFYSLGGYVDFYLSYEANVLLMAVSRDNTHGGQDLYVSFPVDETTWSEPVNLGATINTQKADFAPFLSTDGKTLYFSSYGHDGYGLSDIYKTTRLDDSWQKWSEPVNLGSGINSPREESYFTITGDERHIYFESYDPRNPVRDLFRANLTE
ncbi:hypothetical protein LVD17_27905 [Fulvivirga ulvae]|uniref:hypothetical protein n=1 Tax=Fulvivirga ulvae TaxID=2904245 RepID=UPI001F2B0EAE|nr:hypothetical protein [Fulvivirga ulvae]UII32113.1 hypothetical protein LVD17_27905 [Fulvivirga ulvae]